VASGSPAVGGVRQTDGGKALAEKTGFSLFHNHLIVDAVSAVFPFGSNEFVRLRERFWLEVIETAAAEGRSLIFTFAPESTVSVDFPDCVSTVVEAVGGRVLFVALTLDPEEQERRVTNSDRDSFGKLRSVDLLGRLRADFAECMNAMPKAELTIDTGTTSPANAVARIAAATPA
jgi:hypothetical protein